MVRISEEKHRWLSLSMLWHLPKFLASWAIHISKGHSIDASCFPLIIIASQVQWLQRELNNTIDNKQWFIKSLAYYHSYNFMFRKSTSHLTFWSHDDLGFDIRSLIYICNKLCAQTLFLIWNRSAFTKLDKSIFIGDRVMNSL